jgi:hypothetical protein
MLAEAKALAAVADDDPVSEALDLCERVSDGAIERLEALGLPEDQLQRVYDLCERTLDRIANTAVIWCTTYWPEALADLLAVTPPDLRGRVLDAAELRSHEHPVGRWLFNLAVGRSRIPPGLPAEVARAVLAVHLDRPGEVGTSTQAVCDDCGLERPRAKWPIGWYMANGPRRPDEFFTSCPGCGSAAFTWAGSTDVGRWWTDRPTRGAELMALQKRFRPARHSGVTP